MVKKGGSIMKKLYDKNELLFALIWIGVYVVGFSVADSLSAALGIQKILTVPLGAVLTAILLMFIKRNGLTEKCGLVKGSYRSGQYLYFVPLLILASTNFWGGVTLNGSFLETVLYIMSMIAVGILEEVIFRGLLFTAMRKNSLKRAVVVSSLTFGFGHIVNLLNGAQLLPTLLQIVYASAAGFLFTVIFLKSGSLLPCILTHCAINSFSAFASQRSQTLDMVTAAVLTVVSVAYALWILRRAEPSKT